MNRNVVLLILIALCSLLALSAQEEISQNTTLREFSEKSCIPVRKVIEYLQLPDDTCIDKSLAELNCSSQDLQDVAKRYDQNKFTYQWAIVIVGMGTVFASLILVAVVIGQLRHLDKKKRKSKPQIPAPSSVNLETDQENDIVAAITTTLYLYELELEESNRLMLTWKRTPLSMWKAAKYIPMNEIDPSRRK